MIFVCNFHDFTAALMKFLGLYLLEVDRAEGVCCLLRGELSAHHKSGVGVAEYKMQGLTTKFLGLKILCCGLILTGLRLAYVIDQQFGFRHNQAEDGSLYVNLNIFADDKQYEFWAKHSYKDITQGLKPRRAFKSYGEYLQLQLNKTLNPKLRKLWTTRYWRRKVDGFSRNFEELKTKKLLRKEDRALCIGARVGQEVVALRQIGVWDAIGIDLVAYPPLVLQGDMHRHPFADNSFDFEFSNVFDHALFPHLFASEIQRTLKPGGIAVVHVSLNRRGDRYSANDLYSVHPLNSLFNNCELVYTKQVDCFGLDTEIVLRKNEDGKKSPIHQNLL